MIGIEDVQMDFHLENKIIDREIKINLKLLHLSLVFVLQLLNFLHHDELKRIMFTIRNNCIWIIIN
jgi:hypothetical protein